MKRITIISMVAVLLVAAAAACAPKEDPLALILVNQDQTIELRMSQLRAFPVMEGYGGVLRSTGTISSRAQYRGASLLDVMEKINPDGEPVSVQVEAGDGYAITFNSYQLEDGEFLTYDPQTGVEIPSGQLTAVLAYEDEGEDLDVEKDGRLRLVLISPKDDQVTDGHWWVKNVTRVVIKPLLVEWTLTLQGTLTETMDRATFESGMAEKCHETAFKDDKANVWTGIPLYLLIGRVDDENMHGAGAFNDALADAGYMVELVSADGKVLQLTSARVKRNPNLLIAAQVNANVLLDADFPLRLVGSEVSAEESLAAITTIRIVAAQ